MRFIRLLDESLEYSIERSSAKILNSRCPKWKCKFQQGALQKRVQSGRVVISVGDGGFEESVHNELCRLLAGVSEVTQPLLECMLSNTAPVRDTKIFDP